VCFFCRLGISSWLYTLYKSWLIFDIRKFILGNRAKDCGLLCIMNRPLNSISLLNLVTLTLDDRSDFTLVSWHTVLGRSYYGLCLWLTGNHTSCHVCCRVSSSAHWVCSFFWSCLLLTFISTTIQISSRLFFGRNLGLLGSFNCFLWWLFRRTLLSISVWATYFIIEAYYVSHACF
jgi:hypothetical protein